MLASNARPELNMAEVGFLTGSGMALWNELLPSLPELQGYDINLYGFDIDALNFKKNFENLHRLGSFQSPW